MNQTKTIAVCGKGGVGKTSISALMVKALAKRPNTRILAIDADPAIGLSTALGIEIKRTVDDIRNDLIGTIKKGQLSDKADTLNRLDYEVFDALAQNNNIGLLAIGRPENEGCYCKVNALLKDIIQKLAINFDIILIDGEAGVEQINRRVMKSVNHLVMISDTSAKGINVANTIQHVAHDNKAVDYQSLGIILNRVREEVEVDKIMDRLSLALLGWIPEDDLIRDYDFHGKSFIDFPDTSFPYKVVTHVLDKMAI
jgi:CO dehydrogenase maturation factor